MTYTVTPKFITQGQSFRGGWSKRQIEILGFEWPPKPGWRREAIGREIAYAEADEFLSLAKLRPQDDAVP